MGEFDLLTMLGEHVPFLSWIGPSTVHIASAGFVSILLLVVGFFVWRKARHIDRYIVPPKGFSIVSLFDGAAEALLGLMEGIMGDRAIKYLPLIGSVFTYVFFCNLLAVIPGFVPPTDNINTNLPIAITVFIYYNVMGIREQGLKEYLKHFAGPIIWLAPLMGAIEIISHCVRPISLSVRLFGNEVGDHVVLGIFSDLVPLVIPVIFLGLALFVAFIQAFVFSLLSAVYVGLATEKTSH